MALKANAAAAEFVPGSVPLNVLNSSQGIKEFIPAQDRLADFPSGISALGADPAYSADNVSRTSIKFLPSHVDAPEFFPGSSARSSGFEDLVGRAGEFRPSYQFGDPNATNPSNLDLASISQTHIAEFVPGSHPQYMQSDDFIGITDNSITAVNQGLEFEFDPSYSNDADQPVDDGSKKELDFSADYGVHDKEGWAEVASINLATNSLDQDNSIVYATFDPVEELVWAGTASGRLCSHLVQNSPQECRFAKVLEEVFTCVLI
jgi:hypothetical protein